MIPEDVSLTRSIIQLAGPLVTLGGVALSAYGTYDLTRSYFPLKFLAFARMAVRIAGLFLSGRISHAKRQVRQLIDTAVTPEDRAESLTGLFLIFWGFLAQAVGASLWFSDALWGIVHTLKHRTL